MEVYCIDMNTYNIMSQVELNKTIINRYFEAYNNKNESIFDEIIDPDYIDHGQSAYRGSPGIGVTGAKHDLRYSLDRLDEFNYVVEAKRNMSDREFQDYSKNSLICRILVSF
jgi:hypothetical protein